MAETSVEISPNEDCKEGFDGMLTGRLLLRIHLVLLLPVLTIFGSEVSNPGFEI